MSHPPAMISGACGGGRLERRSGGAVMHRIWLVVVALALLGAGCGGWKGAPLGPGEGGVEGVVEGGPMGPPLGRGEAVVKGVVDGDTIVVHLGGRDERVRLIGIDTPETVDPRK